METNSRGHFNDSRVAASGVGGRYGFRAPSRFADRIFDNLTDDLQRIPD